LIALWSLPLFQFLVKSAADGGPQKDLFELAQSAVTKTRNQIIADRDRLAIVAAAGKPPQIVANSKFENGVRFRRAKTKFLDRRGRSFALPSL
jgi:hypothetical protein